MAAAAAACRLLRLAPRRLRSPRHSPLTALSLLPTPLATSSGWRRYCAAAQASTAPPAAAAAAATGEAVGEFRRRLRVAEVKGGEDEGAAWVEKELTVRGWVRTCRAQRTVTFVELDKRTEETKEALYPRKMHTNDSAAKIRVVMKSFNNQKNNLVGLAPYTQKIGLPESRSLYTVLRSPHIDKKSREQFSMHVKKIFVVKKAETHELAKKFFWLKRMRIMGAQYEIHINFKTRLDKKIGCSKGSGLL